MSYPMNTTDLRNHVRSLTDNQLFDLIEKGEALIEKYGDPENDTYDPSITGTLKKKWQIAADELKARGLLD